MYPMIAHIMNKVELCFQKDKAIVYQKEMSGHLLHSGVLKHAAYVRAHDRTTIEPENGTKEASFTKP